MGEQRVEIVLGQAELAGVALLGEVAPDDDEVGVEADDLVDGGLEQVSVEERRPTVQIGHLGDDELVAMHAKPSVRDRWSASGGRLPATLVAANVHGGTAAEVATDVAGFGGYALDTKVGEGPRGTVWRATHVETGRQVAVKELSPALRGDEEFMARYRPAGGQARRPRRTPEPGAGAGVPGGAGAGVDRRAVGRRQAAGHDRRRPADGGLTPEESVAVVVGVLAGLASTKGIVHGDVRPENIVVAADGTPLVTDFGIPLPLGEDAGEDVYRSAEAVRAGSWMPAATSTPPPRSSTSCWAAPRSWCRRRPPRRAKPGPDGRGWRGRGGPEPQPGRLGARRRGRPGPAAVAADPEPAAARHRAPSCRSRGRS